MRGGIQQRLQKLHGKDAPTTGRPPPDQVETAGGVRQRLGLHDVHKAEQRIEGGKGGIRKRLKLEASSADSKPLIGPDTPLNKKLLRDWARGKINAKDVLETALAAEQQGTPGIEKLAINDVHNASRNLVATVGNPNKKKPFLPRLSCVMLRSSVSGVPFNT